MSLDLQKVMQGVLNLAHHTPSHAIVRWSWRHVASGVVQLTPHNTPTADYDGEPKHATGDRIAHAPIYRVTPAP